VAGVYGARAAAVAELMRADPALAEPMQPDLPYVWAEVAFAVEQDLACTVEDVLGRRVPLMLVGLDQGLDVAERTADLVGARLGWTAVERERQLAHYRQHVSDSRRFRG
jgi:glycerol-3-phosphate dehydrogenase